MSSIDGLQNSLLREISKLREKDNFESSEKFEARRYEELQEIKRKIKIDPTAKIAISGLFDWQYDSEKEIYRQITSVDTEGYEEVNDTPSQIYYKPWLITFESTDKSIGGFQVQNAFGMRFNITRTSALYRHLKIYPCVDTDKSQNYIDAEIKGGLPTLSFNMSPAEARANSKDFRVLYVISDLFGPLVDETKYGPTIDAKTYEERQVRQLTFHVKLSSIWIFNQRTGAIVKKFEKCTVVPNYIRKRKQDVYLF